MKYAIRSHNKLYFVILLSESNEEKYAQKAFLREMELLDYIGISEHPSDQPPLKYPLSEIGGDREELNIFIYLRKLPAAIQSFSRAESPLPFPPSHNITVRTYYYNNFSLRFSQQ